MIRRRKELVMDDVFRADLHAAMGTGDPFEQIMSLDGEIVRALDGRRTFRFELGGRSYFAKLHAGMPLRRILRKLTQLRMPVLGAEPEWRAIQRLQKLGIPTTPPIAFGLLSGCNPTRERSFVITKDLGQTINLAQECSNWRKQSPHPTFKRNLICEVARIARILHEDGMNHRDFYLCHFQMELDVDERAVREGRKPPRLYLMDLHRVQRHKRLPQRARVKDLGGLYFSAMDVGLSRRDLLQFMHVYRQVPLSTTLEKDAILWRKVTQRACWQYKREHGRVPGTQF
jgi:heptose I phosphotransferase